MSNQDRNDSNREKPNNNPSRRHHYHNRNQNANYNRQNNRNRTEKSATPTEMQIRSPREPQLSIDEHKMCICCLHELITYVYYSCMHFVCLQCSVKMRIICQKIDCPVCRQNSDSVICSKELLHTITKSREGCTESEAKANNQKDFDTYMNKFKEKKLEGGFYYAENSIKSEFDTLLEHKCTLCNTSYAHFDDLYTHLKREHKRFYCELCIENLKLFSFERKFYTREDLALHRRQGDPNDKSFKGHPLCKYCDQRFFDRDDLYRHLRKDHFYCHFCDADGCEEYYENYAGLRKHFLQAHFLCEIGECKPKENMRDVREYVVFRREIDFQAHKMQKHAKSKSEAKEMGKLNIEFNYSGDRGGSGAPDRQRKERQRDNDRRNFNLRSQYENYETENRQNDRSETPPSQNVAVSNVVPSQTESFINLSAFEPLGSTISDASGEVTSAHWRNVIANGPAPKINQENDFPSLGGAASGDSKPSFVFHKSLASLGKSIESGGNVWAKKNEKKVAVKPKVTIEKKENLPKEKEIVGSSVNLVDLKSYLSEQKQKETTMQIGKKVDEEIKRDETKKPKKNKKVDNAPATPPPPPGFSKIDSELVDNFSQVMSSVKSPPPGFASVNGAAAAVSSVSVTAPEIDNYKKGPNYEARNQELANKLNDLFTRDKFEKFKQLSAQYRQSSIDAFEYLDRCRKEFFEPHSEDYRKFIDAISDMIALLPNISKQNELYDAFVSMSDVHKSKFRKLSKCHHCDQLLFANELTAHVSANHAPKSEIKSDDDDFPSLSSVAKPKIVAKTVTEDVKEKKSTLASIIDDFPPIEPQKSLKKAVEMSLIEDFPPLSSDAAHRSTFSDMPSFRQQDSLIFNNPKENLSLVNKKKNRYRKFLK